AREFSPGVEHPHQALYADEVDGLRFWRGRAALQQVPCGKLCPIMLKIPVAVGPHQNVQKFEMARQRLAIGELALEGPCQGGNVFRMKGQECSGHSLSS